MVQKLLSENQETLQTSPKVIHVFDREGDIAEVFEQVTQIPNTGIVVRAAHNRALCETESYLWEEVTSQPVQFMMESKLPKTKKRSERQAKLVVRYTTLKLRSPQRLKKQEYFEVYAVYALEIDPPEGEGPVEWMLLTTEEVKNPTHRHSLGSPELSRRQPKPSKDLASRIEDNNRKLAYFVQEIEKKSRQKGQ